MIRLNKIAIIIVIGTILMSGCEQIDITKYKGDGTIALSGNKFFYPGFKIEFDQIDLSRKFSKQYKLIDCPEIDKGYAIGLYAQSKDTNFEDKLNGILRMQLSNKNGTIFNVSSDIKNWRKSIVSFDDYEEYFIYYYDNNKSTIFEMKDLKNIKSMTLFVDFTPNKESKKLLADVLLKAGGSK
jgi:hypothetical protein